MKKHLLTAAAIFALAHTVPGAAQAGGHHSHHHGFYGSIHGGYVDADDHEFDFNPATAVDTELDAGYGIGGAIGYDFGPVADEHVGFRIEGEITYRENDVDTHNVQALGGAQPASTGDVSALSYMANGYVDLHTGTRLTPYLGAGIGMATVDFNGYGIQAVPDVLDDDETVFAYQAIVGLSVGLTERVSLTGDYRYFATDDIEINTAANNATETEYDSHNLMVGLRVKF